METRRIEFKYRNSFIPPSRTGKCEYIKIQERGKGIFFFKAGRKKLFSRRQRDRRGAKGRKSSKAGADPGFFSRRQQPLSLTFVKTPEKGVSLLLFLVFPISCPSLFSSPPFPNKTGGKRGKRKSNISPFRVSDHVRQAPLLLTTGPKRTSKDI